jgi:hypothetical protein
LTIRSSSNSTTPCTHQLVKDGGLMHFHWSPPALDALLDRCSARFFFLHRDTCP